MSNGEVGPGLQYAGFWVRVWASLIDAVLLMIILMPLLIGIYGSEYLSSEKFIHGPLDFLLSWVVPAIAVILFWMYKQATPGKMAVGVKIVDAGTGEAPSTAQCIGRYFAYLISFVPLLLGYLWVAFDRRKQGWHDKLAGTVVVRRVKARQQHPTFDKVSAQIPETHGG